MPNIPAHLLVADAETPKETRDAQLQEILEVSNQSWVARSLLGYTVMRDEDVRAVLRDKRWASALHTLQSMRPGSDAKVTEHRANTLSAMDGENHMRIRRIIGSAVSPAAAERYSQMAYSRAVDLLKKTMASDDLDIVRNFCDIYPMHVLCEAIGIPEEDFDTFIQWAHIFIAPISGAMEVTVKDIVRIESEFAPYVLRLAEDRRNNPQKDIISALADRTGDTYLSDDELLMMVGTLIAGGVETVALQIAITIIYLCDNPEIYAKLRSDSTLISQTIEEVLRLITCVRGTVRIASEDIEYKDVIFPKGTFIFLNITAAHLDKSIHVNPELFDFYRMHHNDLSFSAGAHKCLGINLAKVEMREALRAIVDNIESIELAGTVRYKPSNASIWGPTYIPITAKEKQ